MYRVNADRDRIAGFFSAEVKNVDRLIRQLRRFFKDRDLEGRIFVCELVAREALNNAVLHGCKNDPRKKIEFLLQVGSEEILMKASDEGQGFPWRDYISRASAGMLSSGRGLQILRAFASGLSYNRAGNELVLTIALHSRGKTPKGTQR